VEEERRRRMAPPKFKIGAKNSVAHIHMVRHRMSYLFTLFEFGDYKKLANRVYPGELGCRVFSRSV
jgi:hypothetical protein